jgi:hypothetical protein
VFTVRRAALLSLVAWLADAMCAFAGGAPSTEQELATCGPRAVFLMLQDLGSLASYDEVRDDIPLSPDGASISDLVHCLSSYHVRCTVRRLDPTDLLSCRGPLIAYVPRADRRALPGHFLYVRSVTLEGLDLIDPIDCKEVRCAPWASFSDAWSGVCIVIEQERSISRHMMLVLSIVNFALILPVMWTWLNRHRTFLTCASLRSLWVICILGPSSCCAVAAADSGERLRCNTRDGLNAAAFMLGCATGDNSDLFDVSDQVQHADMSMDEVQALLDSHGCRTALRRLTAYELTHSVPSIVLMRLGSDRGGVYSLVVSADEQQVTLLHAGPMVVEVRRPDEFYRRWTGHALVLVPNIRRIAPEAVIFAVLFLIGCVLGLSCSQRRSRDMTKSIVSTASGG